MNGRPLITITGIDRLSSAVRDQFAAIALQQRTIAQDKETIAARDALIVSRDREIVRKKARIQHLTHEIARLRRLQYAAKSECLDPG